MYNTAIIVVLFAAILESLIIIVGNIFTIFVFWKHRNGLKRTFFLQTKATHFATVVTTVDEVSSDKTKVPDEFIFRSVLLDCFTAELDE